jgi:hypothetical protein
MTTIAIVTSIGLGADPQSCFQAGLDDSGVGPVTIAPPYEAHGNYSILNTLVQNAASIHPDLIVTAGGLVTANAAASVLSQANNDPQFVYLSGILLTTTNQCNSGGVNQNVPIENKPRKDKITGAPFHVDPTRIWLVLNNNNPMSSAEITAWGNTNYQLFFSGSPNPPINSPDPTDNNHFIHEFSVLAGIAQPPLGLVISPDPYFRYWRTAFTIAVADQLAVPVCYSYHDFVVAASTTGNAANSVSLDKPHLAVPGGSTHGQIAATAYYQLGYKAGQFLLAKASGHPRQFVGVTKWDGTAWGSSTDLSRATARQ